MIFPVNHKVSKVMLPGKQTSNFSANHNAPEFASILGRVPFPVSPTRQYQFNSSLLFKAPIKFITVIGSIAYNSIRSIWGKAANQQRSHSGRRTFNVSGYRKTRYVRDRHYLGASAALCHADCKTSFFAGTKLQSMNTSRMSIPPPSYRSSTSSFALRRKTTCLTHCWDRLWHVWYGGYRGGRSLQGAPVRKIHNIHVKINSRSLDGLPLGSLYGIDDTIMGFSDSIVPWSVLS